MQKNYYMVSCIVLRPFSSNLSIHMDLRSGFSEDDSIDFDSLYWSRQYLDWLSTWKNGQDILVSFHTMTYCNELIFCFRAQWNSELTSSTPNLFLLVNNFHVFMAF